MKLNYAEHRDMIAKKMAEAKDLFIFEQITSQMIEHNIATGKTEWKEHVKLRLAEIQDFKNEVLKELNNLQMIIGKQGINLAFFDLIEEKKKILNLEGS